MRTDEFWAVVERARSGAGADPRVVAERATDELAGRDAADVAGFDRHLNRVLAASGSADLFGAAYLINGGCSDEGFAAFRGWLMAQGRSAFAQAVARPDALADLPAVRRAAATGEECGSEPMLGVAREAYRRAGHGELPAAEVPALDTDQFWDVDDEEQVRRRLPRLAALFLASPPE
jgi:hypothetical protein